MFKCSKNLFSQVYQLCGEKWRWLGYFILKLKAISLLNFVFLSWCLDLSLLLSIVRFITSIPSWNFNERSWYISSHLKGCQFSLALLNSQNKENQSRYLFIIEVKFSFTVSNDRMESHMNNLPKANNDNDEKKKKELKMSQSKLPINGSCWKCALVICFNRNQNLKIRVFVCRWMSNDMKKYSF